MKGTPIRTPEAAHAKAGTSRHRPAQLQIKAAGAPAFAARGRPLRIAQPEGDGYLFVENPEQAIQHLRSHGPRADLLTFIQALPDAAPRFPYPFEMDNFAALRVTTFEDWWERGIGFKARNKFRQAEKKGVEIREISFDDDAARGIWEIYNETPIRQGRRFPHYGKDLETVRRMSATFPDLSVFIGAFFQGRMIGFIKLVANQAGTQAGLMHILSLEAHRDKAPTNGLLAHAVRACASRQIKYLVYSSFAYGNKERSSLSDFKERCGFQRMDVPRYYVPLTRWGAVAYRLGLHHGFKERLPESVASRLRDARASWLRRKYGAAGAAS
jgi:hypothetical protein